MTEDNHVYPDEPSSAEVAEIDLNTRLGPPQYLIFDLSLEEQDSYVNINKLLAPTEAESKRLYDLYSNNPINSVRSIANVGYMSRHAHDSYKHNFHTLYNTARDFKKPVSEIEQKITEERKIPAHDEHALNMQKQSTYQFVQKSLDRSEEEMQKTIDNLLKTSKRLKTDEEMAATRQMVVQHMKQGDIPPLEDLQLVQCIIVFMAYNTRNTDRNTLTTMNRLMAILSPNVSLRTNDPSPTNVELAKWILPYMERAKYWFIKCMQLHKPL